MIIGQNIIDEVLAPYTVRMLKSAELDYPYIKGKFTIGPTYYHNPSLQHAADIEIQLCLNQLAYAGIAQMIQNKDIPALNGLEFRELRGENMLIRESRKKFRKPIRTDCEIIGELKINRWKDISHLLLGSFDFQFENNSCIGSLELVVVKPQGGRK